MKALGAVLTVVGAFLGFMQFRRQSVSDLKLGRALVCDLAVLKREICISRRTLPSICLAFRKSRTGAVFWEPLGRSLEMGGIPVQNCWETMTGRLPDNCAVRLAPLGPLLGDGGVILAKAIDEVREELLRDLIDAERNISLSMRLAGAVCLSCACFLILMFY